MSTTHAKTSGAPSDWSPGWWSFYVILPVLLLALILAVRFAGGESINQWFFDSHVGVLESATGVLALVAGIVVLLASFHPGIRRDWTVRGWLLVFFAAMVYFAGEDLNWGQHYLGWESPQYFLEHNREKETNLHNMSSWFNQKPRLAVELWLLVACIAVPLGWQLPRRLTARIIPAMFWPDRRLVLVAALALLVLATDWLSKNGVIPRTLRWSEVQEVYFVYAWLVYAFMLRARIRAQGGATVSSIAN